MDGSGGKIPLRPHWIPRFVSAGVLYEDLQELLSRIDRWDLWCQEWSAKAAVHEQLGRDALAGGHSVSAGQALSRAATYYHFAGFRFYNDWTQKAQADRKAWECYWAAAPVLQPARERIDVPFDGIRLAASLRVPVGVRPSPCVIIIAGMDSRKEELSKLEDEFLARGLATVSYDGPGQGEVWRDAKLRHDSERAAVAIVDYLAGRPEIDAGRIGVYGWAMGGYYAPRAAAAEPRIRACVSMPIRYGLEIWDQLAEAETSTYQYLFGNVSYEEGRHMGAQFSLEGVLPRVRCPYLIVHGDRGAIVGRDEAERAAREAGGPTRLVVFEDGDHLCINIRYRSWPLMIDWFVGQLRG